MSKIGVVQDVLKGTRLHIFGESVSLPLVNESPDFMVGDVVSYGIDPEKPWIIQQTGFVEAVVITSNPVNELPMVQSLASWFKYHIVLAENARYGQFIMTPVNTGIFFNRGCSPLTEFRNYDFNDKDNAIPVHKEMDYLPELLRFYNLKPGDKICVSRENQYAIGTPDKPLQTKYVYTIKQWPPVKSR